MVALGVGWGVGLVCRLFPWPPSVRLVLLVRGQEWPNRGTFTGKQKTNGVFGVVAWGWLLGLGWFGGGGVGVVWSFVGCLASGSLLSLRCFDDISAAT